MKGSCMIRRVLLKASPDKFLHELVSRSHDQPGRCGAPFRVSPLLPLPATGKVKDRKGHESSGVSLDADRRQVIGDKEHPCLGQTRADLQKRAHHTGVKGLDGLDLEVQITLMRCL